jgi:drug/metabolite transporter (DMT)-like permease
MDPSPFPIGEIAALASAACWAVASILWTRQMSVSSPIAMNLFKTGFCLPLFVISLLLASRDVPLAGVGAASVGVLVISGIVGMSVGDTLYFAGLARIGARRSMMILTLSPLFTAGLSALAGQKLPTVAASCGVGLVLVGLILVLRERPVGMVMPGRARSGVVFALGAALCQALGIVLTKQGLVEADILEASTVRIFGGVVGILGIQLVRGRLGATVRHTLQPPSLRRIVPATLLGTFLGFHLLQAAVHFTEPAVAAALTGTSPLFVAPLSVVFLRETMRAGGWIGTVLTVAGVALVMLS